MTSIIDAVKSNNSRILKLHFRVPRELPQEELRLCLLLAAKSGYTECVQCLLEHTNVETNIKDRSGNTPLHLACQENCSEIVEMLMKHGSCVNDTASGISTPLHVSSRWGYDDCVEKLLASSDINVNAKDSAGYTPLMLAVKHSRYIILHNLILAKCDVNLQDKSGKTALHYGSQKAQCVKILLKAGADTNIVDEDHNTPLLYAAVEGFDKVVGLLCDTDCDVNIKSSSLGRTALHILSYKGHQDCIEDLVRSGADINLYDEQFHTPLWYAVSNNKTKVVRMLLQANSQVDTFQCSDDIPTEACPVRIALEKGHINMIKMFIVTGFDKKHLKQCLSDTELARSFFEHEDIDHWSDHAHGVLTLKQSCRKWIRHHLGCYLFHDIKDIPIPNAMKDYITMKELEDH